MIRVTYDFFLGFRKIRPYSNIAATRRTRFSKRGFAMMTFHEEYLVDDKGTKKSVVIPVEEWERVLEAMEELEDPRL